MDKLISKEEAIETLGAARPISWTDYGKGYNDGIDFAVSKLSALPSAEPDWKTGKWMFSRDHTECRCTICNFKIYGRPYYNTYLIVPYNYCPNCGAKMEVDYEAD